KVIVLGGPKAIGRESSGRGITERIASRIGLGRVDSRGQLGQERVIPSVQRKVVHASRIDNLTYRSILSLQLGSICLDLKGFVYGTRLQGEINHNSRADVNNDASGQNCLKALERSEELMKSYPDCCELVGAIRRRYGRHCGIRIGVRQRDLGSTDWSAGSVRHNPQDGAGVDLGLERNRAQQYEGCR